MFLVPVVERRLKFQVVPPVCLSAFSGMNSVNLPLQTHQSNSWKPSNHFLQLLIVYYTYSIILILVLKIKKRIYFF